MTRALLVAALALVVTSAHATTTNLMVIAPTVMCMSQLSNEQCTPGVLPMGAVLVYNDRENPYPDNPTVQMSIYMGDNYVGGPPYSTVIVARSDWNPEHFRRMPK